MATGIFVRQVAEVAGGDDGGTGVAVVGAIAGEHLVAAGVEAGHADEARWHRRRHW